MVKVLDSKFEGCEFKAHIGHGSFSKLRQFRLPYFTSVYSAANEYKPCLDPKYKSYLFIMAVLNVI